MKQIFVVASLCMLTSFSFAQKKAVKDAKSAMEKNVEEARGLIKPALTDPETMSDPETWKIAGDIEYTAFAGELTKEQLRAIKGEGGNEEVMYTGLINMYDPYVVADSLGQLPDSKGKVKNKFRKDIVKNLKEAHPYYINAGIYYNDKKDYGKASEFFEKYWSLPQLAMFQDSKDGLVSENDSTYQTIKYYAVITAIQSENHNRAITLLKKLISEPYHNNSVYKESDPYELLASEYQQQGDSLAFVTILRQGSEKFPSNQYFTPNLINEYIKAGKTTEALDYLDQAIKNDPSNTCDLKSVKASLFADKKDYDQAEVAYNEALGGNANCERALEGLGVLYILRAQDLKEKASQSANRKEQAEFDKQTSDLYQKSLPYLEKYRDLLNARKAENSVLKSALLKLQNVYYNLSLLNVDKSKEYNEVNELLNSL